MRTHRRNGLGGSAKFFRVGVAHNTLKNYFQTNFALMQHHKWALIDIENMMPWERDVYTMLLEDWLKKERDRIKMEQEHAQNMQQAAQRRSQAGAKAKRKK